MRRTFYGSESSNTCAFCAFHGKSLTPKQLKQKGCLGKNCTALIRHEHPYWDAREGRKAARKERKKRLEQEYRKAIGGEADAVHTETASAEGT